MQRNYRRLNWLSANFLPRKPPISTTVRSEMQRTGRSVVIRIPWLKIQTSTYGYCGNEHCSHCLWFSVSSTYCLPLFYDSVRKLTNKSREYPPDRPLLCLNMFLNMVTWNVSDNYWKDQYAGKHSARQTSFMSRFQHRSKFLFESNFKRLFNLYRKHRVKNTVFIGVKKFRLTYL